MKKIILLISLVAFLSSCNFVGSIIDNTTYELLENVEFYDFAEYDLSGLDSLYKISSWINHRVYYKSDYIEEFYPVEQTMNMGYADCEDFCFVMMNIAYLTMGIKMDMVVVHMDQRTVVEGGIDGNHVVVRYDGVNYSAQGGGVSPDQEVLYIYSFDEVFGF